MSTDLASLGIPPPHVRTTSSDSSSSDDQSAYDTRGTTPDPPLAHQYTRPIALAKTWNEKDEHVSGADVEIVPGGVGLLPDEVYDRTLSWWRAGIRRWLVANLVWESKAIAAMQNRVRLPFLDRYFVNTSTLGTHTFFMTLLPSLIFFGYGEVAHGLIFILAFGVYLSSVIKDLVCSPRPFAPPVSRLTIGTHHLEYGFPSTHSTNSVSIALYFFSIINDLYKTPVAVLSSSQEDLATQTVISWTTYVTCIILLAIYTVSIVYGRLYTGMHSFTDCAFGVFLGAAIWGVYALFGDMLNSWLRNATWSVPVVIIPACLLMVHRHPEPVDDCPCFEDAIAFMAVVMGESLTMWYMAQNGYDETFFVHRMPGNMFGTWAEMWGWWSTAAAKLVIGILAIFVWRIFAKFLLHRILPPTFRFLAQIVTLPHRRFYTPATDYKDVPVDKGLHPIPSVLDLPGMLELEVDGVSTARTSRSALGARGLKMRAGRGLGSGRPEKGVSGSREGLGLGLEEMGEKPNDVVRHYDADVLTKVFVYCGIGILASGVMPVVFEVIGWGL